jgi:hypothetical protein
VFITGKPDTARAVMIIVNGKGKNDRITQWPAFGIMAPVPTERES